MEKILKINSATMVLEDWVEDKHKEMLKSRTPTPAAPTAPAEPTTVASEPSASAETPSTTTAENQPIPGSSMIDAFIKSVLKIKEPKEEPKIEKPTEEPKTEQPKTEESPPPPEMPQEGDFIGEKIIKEADLMGMQAAATRQGAHPTVGNKSGLPLIPDEFNDMVGLPKEKTAKIIEGLLKNFLADWGGGKIGMKPVIPGLKELATSDFNRFKNSFIQYISEYQRIMASPKSKLISQLTQELVKLDVDKFMADKNKPVTLIRAMNEAMGSKIDYKDSAKLKEYLKYYRDLQLPSGATATPSKPAPVAATKSPAGEAPSAPVAATKNES